MQLNNLQASELNNTKDAQYDLVYFIRVPKTGSQALTYLMQAYLKKLNNYKIFIRTPPLVEKPFISLIEQESIVKESILHGQNTVFIGMHENYIEYARFNLTRPIFISLIRNPIEKEISWYYYLRSRMFNAKNSTKYIKQIKNEGGEKFWRNKTFEQCINLKHEECQYIPLNPKRSQHYKRQILQFCGNHKACWKFGSPLAIQIAKDNIERNFAVVGTLEEPEITMTVLEKYIPKYFKGALEQYKKHKGELLVINKNYEKPMVNDEIKKMLYTNFTGELEFYNFCKQRLYKQYLAVKKGKTPEH